MKDQIKKLREARELSQVALAEKLKVSQSTVAMWETGENSPRADKLPELARILGCTIDDLFKEEEKGA